MKPVSVTVGTHRLTYLPDGYVQLHPRTWYPASPDSFWSGKGDHLDADGCLVGSVGALLVEYGNQAMLVDTGFGPARIPADRTIAPLGRIEGGALPASLAAVGRTFASVSCVAFTHLHDDHVGWATDPGLRNARFVTSAEEWRGEPRAVAGHAAAVSDGEEIFPGVRALATPGHTPGHLSYVIGGEGAGGEPGGARAVVVGDVLHSPLQLADLSWNAFSDTDPARAVHSRKRIVAELSRPGTIGYAGHFAGAVFGRLALHDEPCPGVSHPGAPAPEASDREVSDPEVSDPRASAPEAPAPEAPDGSVPSSGPRRRWEPLTA
ncbi:MBL fold metallo-hydrolase [Streptomyces iconiensis]|uniref:MBL fold metallo-hydrolase n=1 Tax=Streptomyces iconiensis TaxID=1384038 RepID=A0ABT6ZSL9_9ACTN|nr:MBL fold metallo-hydrolase [Streptomyces iconiensis]MDJ1132040.1 MBL fold metallo-hydrolase [Streptomyces iconiensis]